MKKILVLGSANTDITLSMDKVPAAGQCILAHSVTKGLGGKGLNQSIAASRQGAHVTFVGKLGRDEAAQAIEAALGANGVHAEMLYSENEPTGSAYILLESDSQNRIMVYGGANQDFNGKDLVKLQALIRQHEVLLVQLEISLPFLQSCIRYAIEQKKQVIIDCGPARPGLLHYFQGVSVISPNETELAVLTGIDTSSLEDKLTACRLILAQGAQAVLVKLGAEGCLWVTNDCWKHYPPYRVKAVDSTGAGDSFTAAFVVARLEGKAVADAIGYAMAAGALAVTKKGAMASMPTLQETLAFLAQQPQPLS